MGKYERQAQSLRKHGPIPSSGASKAPALPPLQRPDWRGSGYIKKRPSRQQTAISKEVPVLQEQRLPIELQQLLLNIFRDSFPASDDFEKLKPTLHEINNALLQKDFEKAFDGEERLEGYALRWSPSRSLAYSNVLAWICDQRPEDDWVKRMLDPEPQSRAKVVCFGGGAAEVMAFAGLLRHLRSEAAGQPQQPQSSEPGTASETPSIFQAPAPMLDLHLVDAANWSSVLSKLQTGLTTRPTLSKYASASARASNAALLSPNALKVTFRQVDILDLNTEELHNMIGSEPLMITLLLTLNDLYTTSIPKTTAFLRKLDALLPKGSLLLVIDNIGASSEAGVVNQQESQPTERQSYPMDWLLDRVLLGKAQKDDEEPKATVLWEKVIQGSIRHHKLDEKLRYPGSMENMKFQLHMFKRL